MLYNHYGFNQFIGGIHVVMELGVMLTLVMTMGNRDWGECRKRELQ